MRSICASLSFALLCLQLVPPSASAADPIAPKPLDWRPISIGGLNVSLATSGYQFEQVRIFLGAASTNGSNILPGPEMKTSFVASVCLSNRSRSAIPFSFNDAGPRWIFRILDSADQEVWRSNSDIGAAQVIIEDVLGAGRSWKTSARIPIIIGSTPLAAGVYTLQAVLNADKSVSATTPFEIVQSAGLDTGIRGSVTKEITFNGDPVSGKIPGSWVRVTVTEISTDATLTRPSPFSWSGRADSEGRFAVNAPAGRYRVEASDWEFLATLTSNAGNLVPGSGEIAPKFPNASAEVTVQDGAFTDVTLRMTKVVPPPVTNEIVLNP